METGGVGMTSQEANRLLESVGLEPTMTPYIPVTEFQWLLCREQARLILQLKEKLDE